MLEYEIEFPKGLMKQSDAVPILPGGICDITMPVLPGMMKEPETFDFDLANFPHRIIEKVKIPDLPKSIWDEKKFRLGKPPKPLKPKPFQKVLNTIPMPMRIKNVPFKPIVTKENTRGRG